AGGAVGRRAGAREPAAGDKTAAWGGRVATLAPPAGAAGAGADRLTGGVARHGRPDDRRAPKSFPMIRKALLWRRRGAAPAKGPAMPGDPEGSRAHALHCAELAARAKAPQLPKTIADL